MFSRFIRSQTQRIFVFLHIINAIHCNFRNRHQLFYKRSSSCKIRALPLSNVFWHTVSMAISITLKITFNQTQILYKNWCNFHMNLIKRRLVKRQLKILGMAQYNLYRTTLTRGCGRGSINHMRTQSRPKCFVQFQGIILTKQSDLAIGDYCARKACTDTCNCLILELITIDRFYCDAINISIENHPVEKAQKLSCYRR